MKRTIVKSRTVVRFIVAPLLVLALVGCGFVASVPWITNADNNSVVNIGDSIFALSGKRDYSRSGIANCPTKTNHNRNHTLNHNHKKCF